MYLCSRERFLSSSIHFSLLPSSMCYVTATVFSFLFSSFCTCNAPLARSHQVKSVRTKKRRGKRNKMHSTCCNRCTYHTYTCTNIRTNTRSLMKQVSKLLFKCALISTTSQSIPFSLSFIFTVGVRAHSKGEKRKRKMRRKRDWRGAAAATVQSTAPLKVQRASVRVSE